MVVGRTVASMAAVVVVAVGHGVVAARLGMPGSRFVVALGATTVTGLTGGWLAGRAQRSRFRRAPAGGVMPAAGAADRAGAGHGRGADRGGGWAAWTRSEADRQVTVALAALAAADPCPSAHEALVDLARSVVDRDN
jgi:hypothetical protein